MALQYPGYTVPQPTTTKFSDLLAIFDDQFAKGQAAKYEREAPDAFAAYLDSLGLGTPRPVAPGLGNAMYASAPAGVAETSSAAAAGATDPKLSAALSAKGYDTSGGPGNPAAKTAMQFFIGKGYTPAQAAGIVGNLMHESGLRTAALNPGDGVDGSNSIGIAQWNGPRAKALQAFAAQNGGDPNALETQLAFVDHELNTTETSALKAIQAATNPVQAAAAFAGYERPQGWTPENPYGALGWSSRARNAAQLAGGTYDVPTAAVPSAGASAPIGVAQADPASLIPPRETMLRLFANPVTRPLAIELAKSAQAGVAAKPVEINGQLVDPRTGKVLGDYRDPPKPDLASDQKLLQQINAERQAAGQQPLTLEQFLLSKKDGGLQITTNPDGTVSVTQGGSGMPKQTEAQSKDTVFVTRASGALPIVDALGEKLTSLGENIAGNVPYGQYFQSDDYQKADNAGREFLAAILRKDTGAAVTDSEMTNYGATYLPRPGDKPGVLAQKKAARARAVKAISLGLPPAVILELEKQGVVIPDLPSADAPTTGDLPAGVTEEDIQYTMQQHGLTRGQVLEQLNAP